MERPDRFSGIVALSVTLLAVLFVVFGCFKLLLQRYGIAEPPEPELPEILLTVTPPLEQNSDLVTGWWVRVPRPPIRSFTVHKFEDCVEVEIIQCPDSGHSFCFPSVFD